MVEREHFTNGRCFAGGTGLALMLAAFATQVSGWPHWITIGIGYGSGLVLMVLATIWITKSYYARDSRGAEGSSSKLITGGEAELGSKSSIEDLFTPLQMDAFRLAKDLEQFRRGLGEPPSIQPPNPGNVDEAYNLAFNAWASWNDKLRAKYELNYKERAITVYRRFVAEGIKDIHFGSLADTARNESTLKELISTLREMALKVEAQR